MVTTSDVQLWLRELARWTPLLPATWSDTPMRASRTGDGVHVRLSHAPLPGGMERLIDDWQSHGVLGIHTQIGVRQALGPWQDELRGMGGPTASGSPVTYLQAHLDWARAHMDPQQWAYMAADVHAVWERVQHLVCPAVERDGTCPECGARIEWVMGSEGRVNMPICPAGHVIRNLTAQQLQRIRNADQTDAPAYATMKEVQQLFPKLKGGTLRKWVFEEKVRKEGNRYCINDISTRIEKTRPAA